MKAAAAKKISAGVASAVLAFSLSVLPLARAYANMPYLKVTGGDASSGGWFSPASGGSCTASPNFQDDSFNSDNSYGGIYTFAQPGGAGYEGASADYGVYSLGKIDGGTPPNGFFSDAVSASAAPSVLSFANINSLNPPGFIGGMWGGGVKYAAQCIPDYYDIKKPSLAVSTASPLSTSLSGISSYTINAPSPSFTLLSGNTTVNASADISVFVNGNAYIDHNIVYGPHNVTNIPRFALIVKGSIFIAPGVTQLDGLYIAQPDAASFNNPAVLSTDVGDVWTCHDNNTPQPTAPFVLGNCGSNLTFNGAVIAKQLFLMRINGDVNDNNSNPAERFNYTPEMVLGGPFFPTDNQISGSSGPSKPVFQSILSLPPVL